MHEIFIHDFPGGVNSVSPHARFQKDFLRAEKQNVRIYQTYVNHPKKKRDYVIATTTKDTHLFLGTLTHEGLCDLVAWLEEECATTQCTELLLFLGTAGQRTKDLNRCLYIVRQSGDEGSAKFSISIAH